MYADGFEDSIKILESLKDEDLVLVKIKHPIFGGNTNEKKLI